MITKQELTDNLRYEEGQLYWIKPRQGRILGKPAGTLREDGYILIRFGKWRLYAHRLVWLFFNDSVPKMIDHIDKDPTNNRIGNLRETNHSENARNVGPLRNNTSGTRGVSWHKSAKKWRARYSVNKEIISLGVFDTKEQAITAIMYAKGAKI